MKRNLAVLFLFSLVMVLSSFSLDAQQPVRWRTKITTTEPARGIVTIKALITPGWHLYGLTLPENGPKPTTFDFANSKGITFTGKIKPNRKATDIEDPMFGMTLSWWDETVEFSIPFKVTGSDPQLHCIISYMACDGSTCMPPAKETISTPIKLSK